MFFRRMIPLFFGLLLLFAVGSMVSRNAFRSGWQQGYLTAKVDSLADAKAEGTDSAEAIPPAPSNFGHGYGSGMGANFNHRGFSPFGFIVMAFVSLFVLKMIFGGRHYRHHRYAGHCGPRGKRHWNDWDHHDDEPVQKA